MSLKTKTVTISRVGSVLMALVAVVAAGLAYGHTRLSLASSSSLSGNYPLVALHLDASKWFADYDSRWHYSTARMLLAAAESNRANGAILRESAISHLQSSLSLSPMWSDPWTWLAISRLQQGNTDAFFDLAFARSISLGPNEARNLVALFPWALLEWRELTATQQHQLLELADRSARSKPAWVVSTALQYGQLYRVCDRMETRVWAQKQCQQSGWEPAMKTEP